MVNRPARVDDAARVVWRRIRELVAAPDVVANEHRFMHEAELTAGPVRALRALLTGGPQPMRALAEYLGCDKSYVTGLVKPLLANGLVTLQSDRSDGRVKIVALTAPGAALARRAQEVHDTPPAELAALDLAELDTLCELLAGHDSARAEGS